MFFAGFKAFAIFECESVSRWRNAVQKFRTTSQEHAVVDAVPKDIDMKASCSQDCSQSELLQGCVCSIYFNLHHGFAGRRMKRYMLQRPVPNITVYKYSKFCKFTMAVYTLTFVQCFVARCRRSSWLTSRLRRPEIEINCFHFFWGGVSDEHGSRTL